MASKEKPQLTELQDLLDAVENRRDALSRAKSAVNGEECALANAVNALGKIVVPDTARPGEGFCVLVEQGKGEPPRRIVVRKKLRMGVLGDYEVEDWKPTPVGRIVPEIRMPATEQAEGPAES